jgi:hypothetical protein
MPRRAADKTLIARAGTRRPYAAGYDLFCATATVCRANPGARPLA